jgi:hypothetical protein
MSKISYQGSPRKAVMSQPTDSFEFAFTREDEAGIIHLTCDAVADLYIAVMSEDEIRPAIERGLKKVMGARGYKKVSVKTDGSLAGPLITSIAHRA